MISYLSNTYQLVCLSPPIAASDEAFLNIKLLSRKTISCEIKENCKLIFDKYKSPWLYKIMPQDFITGSILKIIINQVVSTKELKFIEQIISLKVSFFNIFIYKDRKNCLYY